MGRARQKQIIDLGMEVLSEDVLTQLALADICGPSRALHKHSAPTDFLQKGSETT